MDDPNRMECAICYSGFEHRIRVTLPCGGNADHALCLSCFIHLQKRECPLCRASFVEQLPHIAPETKVNLILFLNTQPDSPERATTAQR